LDLLTYEDETIMLSRNVRHQTSTSNATTYSTDLKVTNTKAVSLKVCTGNQKLLPCKVLLFKIHALGFQSHKRIFKPIFLLVAISEVLIIGATDIMVISDRGNSATASPDSLSQGEATWAPK
jgi:hypothetical protein